MGLAGRVSGGGDVKGGCDGRARLKVELAAGSAAAKTVEALQGGAPQAESHTLAQLRVEKEQGDARAKALEAALRKSHSALADCRIDADTLFVLNDDTGAPAPNDAAGDRPAAPALASGSTCEALAVTFDENHKRFSSNLTQLLACQAFYSDVRERYCKDTKAC